MMMMNHLANMTLKLIPLHMQQIPPTTMATNVSMRLEFYANH